MNYSTFYQNLIFTGDYHYSSMAMTSSQRPDVVPGNAIDSVTRYHKSSMKYSEFDDGNSSISAMNQGIINDLV